jgi:hypothetical protein
VVLSIGCSALRTLLTDRGVSAFLVVRTGWAARRTPLGTNALDKNPMVKLHFAREPTIHRRSDIRVALDHLLAIG